MKFMVVEQAIGRIKEMVSKGNPYYIQEEQKCCKFFGKDKLFKLLPVCQLLNTNFFLLSFKVFYRESLEIVFPNKPLNIHKLQFFDGSVLVNEVLIKIHVLINKDKS